MGYMLIFVILCIIICYNCVGNIDKVDGIVIMFFYNFFLDGGFKYNLFYGGFVDSDVIK